jgi:hypothetical protein
LLKDDTHVRVLADSVLGGIAGWTNDWSEPFNVVSNEVRGCVKVRETTSTFDASSKQVSHWNSANARASTGL